MNGQRIVILVVAVLVLGAIVAGFAYIKGHRAPKVQPNWYQNVITGSHGFDMQRAIDLAVRGDTKESLELLNSVRTATADPGERAVVDLTIASVTFFDIDRYAGAQLYADVSKNNEYPAISRAYAMLVIADQFDGLQDKSLLKPFFENEKFANTDKSALIKDLYQQIYATHPFGLAAAKLAIAHILNVRDSAGAISDKDYQIAMAYIDAIDVSLKELETTGPFRNFIPVTLLTKASLYRLLESASRPVSPSVDDIYLAAIARARTLKITATEQFSVLYYADYLAKQKMDERIAAVLSQNLSTSSIVPMVKDFLASESSFKTVLPNLYLAVQRDPSTRKIYQDLVK